MQPHIEENLVPNETGTDNLDQFEDISFPSSDYPPEVINAGKSLGGDILKKSMEEAALVIKTTYW